MGSEDRRALLGRMAGLGWFTQNGEVAATQALAMLAEHRLLRDALLDHLARCTGIEVGAVRWFESEHFTDGGRVDLAGVDADGAPLVAVEAKFGAFLTSEQVGDYLSYQELRLGPGVPGVLAVLVPTSRRSEADRVVAAMLAARAGASPTPTAIAALVLTWDEWLEVWQDAVAHLPATPDSLAADLVQLRSLCLALGGLVIPPIPTGAYDERREDLATVVDQVTRELSEGEGRLAPTQHEVGYGPFRYIPGGFPGTSLSLGVADRFASEGLSPLWLRYHKLTGLFSAVRARVMTSSLAGQVRTDGGHLWLPLTVPDDAAGPELATGLVRQIREIREMVTQTRGA